MANVCNYFCSRIRYLNFDGWIQDLARTQVEIPLHNISITQKLLRFYYVTYPANVDESANLLSTPWFELWTKEYFRTWFTYLDSPLSAITLEVELNNTDYLKDSLTPPSGFMSFNQYYIREFIRRPIDRNNMSFSSPVDGCVSETTTLSSNPFVNVGGFKVSAFDFFKLSNYSSSFANGIMIHQVLDNNGNFFIV